MTSCRHEHGGILQESNKAADLDLTRPVRLPHTNSFKSKIQKTSSMEGTTSLIHLINELHDISTSCGQNLDINLPQIAVVGSQSSGKSSVLDGIVGKYVISF